MFHYTIDKIHILLVVYSIFCYVFIYFLYDIRYRRKYKEFTDEMHNQYINLYKKAKEEARQEALANVMNIDRQKKFHNECPYCNRKYEDALPTL
jgi:hypothetical protein